MKHGKLFLSLKNGQVIVRGAIEFHSIKLCADGFRKVTHVQAMLVRMCLSLPEWP
jgi:hypothetical protein